jgi:hypothetical protein
MSDKKKAYLTLTASIHTMQVNLTAMESSFTDIETERREIGLKLKSLHLQGAKKFVQLYVSDVSLKG